MKSSVILFLLMFRPIFCTHPSQQREDNHVVIDVRQYLYRVFIYQTLKKDGVARGIKKIYMSKPVEYSYIDQFIQTESLYSYWRYEKTDDIRNAYRVCTDVTTNLKWWIKFTESAPRPISLWSSIESLVMGFYKWKSPQYTRKLLYDMKMLHTCFTLIKQDAESVLLSRYEEDEKLISSVSASHMSPVNNDSSVGRTYA